MLVVDVVTQELCREWSSKPRADKQFEPFYRAISAVAFSSGIKLKTHAVVLNSVGSLSSTIAVSRNVDSSMTKRPIRLSMTFRENQIKLSTRCVYPVF